MKHTLAVVLVLLLYVLHQDVWFWRQARPLVFGMLPIGLAYHAAFTIVTSAVLILLVRLCWPSGLDPESRPPE